ncbi:hypothetical protein PILCRDRAFT_816529, partial [Piloderma croceum F 1598]
MSDLRTSAPIQSSPVAETQVHASDGQDTPLMVPTEPLKRKKKCLVLSLIRHGQSQSNVFGGMTEENDHLTQYGREQAERLGKDWKDVRIDVLRASTLQRAHHTALEIAKYHCDDTLEVITKKGYVERKPGSAVTDALRAGNQERAATLYNGLSPGQSGPTPRDYKPPGGGESPNLVASRANIALVVLLYKYGKELDEPPKEFVDKTVIDSPNVLPEGIPHVVLVSHNIFLAELYESMFGWNSDAHRMTTCNYRNADWSRHIIWFDEDTDYLEYSDMRVPCKIELYTPRVSSFGYW